MEFFDLAKIFTELGTLAGLVIFFVWQSSKREMAHEEMLQREREAAIHREARLGERIAKLEEFEHKTLIELVSKSTRAISECAQVMIRLEKFLEKANGGR
jgi:hypothetical protein